MLPWAPLGPAVAPQPIVLVIPREAPRARVLDRREDFAGKGAIPRGGDGPIHARFIARMSDPGRVEMEASGLLPMQDQSAQALEDAVALGLVLAAVAGRDVPAALRRYEAIRSRRTARIVHRARRIARVRTSRSRVLSIALRAAVSTFPSGALTLSRLIRVPDPYVALRLQKLIGRP